MSVEMRNIIGKVTRPLARRLRLMISRGLVTLVSDSLAGQTLQVELNTDEVQGDVEHFQEYGLTSVPFAGAEALFLSVGGNRSHGVVVSVSDRRHRPTGMNPGDACLYTDKGERVYLDRDNDIVNLGAKSAADFVALAAKTDSRLDDLETHAGSHTHTYVAPLHPSLVQPGSTGAASGAPSGTTTAADKVKAT